MNTRLPKTVDRSFVRLVTTKRLITGTLGIVAGAVLTYLGLTHQAPPSPLVPVAILIFWGGGAWSLRDGLRTHRALRR